MFKSAKFIALEKFTTILIGFVISMVLIKHLGPIGNAHLSQALGLSYLLSSVIKFGIDDILQERHQRLEHSSIFSVSSLIFERITVLFIVAILFFTFDIYKSYFLGSNNRLLFALLVFSGVISFDFGIHYLRGMKKNHFNNILMSLNPLILLILVMFGIYSKKELPYFLYSYCFSLGFAHLGAFYISGKMSERRTYINIAIPVNVKIYMLLNAGMAMLYFRMDAIFLPVITGAFDAGRYIAAQRTADIIPGSFVIFASVALPWIKNAIARGEELKLIAALVQITTLLSLLAISILYVLYDNVILAIIGDEYVGTSCLVLIFGLSLPALILGAYADVIFILRKKYSFILLKTAIAVLIKGVLFVLTPENTSISTFAFYSFFSASCATILVCWYADKAIITTFLETFNLQRLRSNVTHILENTRD